MSNPMEGRQMELEMPKVVESTVAVEKRLLDTVLEVAGDNENMIRNGIIKALRGENDKARRTYLWNLLDRKAKERIRNARRKFAA